jgi:hypothetical protein
LHPGQTAVATAHVSNDLAKRPPIQITAGASYQDWTGATFQATPATISLDVIQPLSFKRLTISLASNTSYVAGSATSTVPVTATYASQVLTLDFDKTLLEAQSLDISFGLLTAP